MGIKSVNKGNRILLFSFALTFIALSLVALAIIYIPSLKTVQHLPASYDVTAPDWMRFVVPGMEKVTFMNFTEIYRTTGGYTIFTSDKLLELSGYSTQVTVPKSLYSVVALYQNPNPNSDDLALNILKIDPLTYSALQDELRMENSTNFNYLGSVLYKVTRSTSDSPPYSVGYICLQGGYLLYSDGIDGMKLIKSALDNEAGNARIIDDPKVKAAFYILSLGKRNELAFSYSNFPYSISDVIATSTTVSYEGNSIATRNLYTFNSTNIAQQDLDKIKQANLNASDFQVIDNYILVIAKYDKANLLGELRSL